MKYINAFKKSHNIVSLLPILHLLIPQPTIPFRLRLCLRRMPICLSCHQQALILHTVTLIPQRRVPLLIQLAIRDLQSVDDWPYFVILPVHDRIDT